MLKSRRFWLGLALSLLFIGLFLYRADPGRMGLALTEANYWYVIPGVFCYLGAMWWRTVRWQIILSPVGHLRVSRLWPVMIVGYAANNLLPVRLGELVRAYYLSSREGVSKTTAVATILMERTFDGIALLLIVGVVSLFLPVATLFQGLGDQARINWMVLTLGLSLPFFIVTIGLFMIGAFPKKVEGLLRTTVFRLIPPRARPQAWELLLRFLTGLSVMRNPSRVIAMLVLSLPIWLFEAAVYFLIAVGFGFQDSFASWGLMTGVMILSVATSNLGTAIPSTGGGVGPFEFFVQATLVIFGIGVASASAYAIVLHFILLAPNTLLGLVYLGADNLSLARLAKATQAKEIPVPPAEGSIRSPGS
ncbi:MAG: flippase-like domain-containing protein [Chloroflexi bacterium]|nr:flippase-like domain-containing protein [Chloroflexota bacterium]